MSNIIKLYTNSATTINDLGEISFSHPTSAYVLTNSFTLEELKYSYDLQTNINDGHIYITDNVGKVISNISNYSGDMTMYGNIIPSDSTTSLGTLANQWGSLYVSGSTIYMQGVPLSLISGTTVGLSIGNGEQTSYIATTTTSGSTADLSNYATITNLNSHTGNTNNPHNVTTTQIGAVTSSSFNTYTSTTAPSTYATIVNLNVHTGNTSNPHNTTIANLSGNTITYPISFQKLTYDGSRWVNNYSITGTTSGLTSINLASIPTSTNTVTGIRIRTSAYCTNNSTIMGYWSRCVVIYNTGNTAYIKHINADTDYQTNGLTPTSIGFTIGGGNVLVDATGITNAVITWTIKYDTY